MRTKLSKIAQAATLGLAITFTLSCSSGDLDSGGGGGGNGGGSCSAGETVVIGSQTFSCSSGGDGDPTCGGKLYDTGKYGCVNNELVGTCGGSYYNPEYERCLNGEIQNGAEITFPSSGSGGSCSAGEAVVIGSQTWMKRNLNCDVSGSKCYDDDPANCVKYGRLYDWATAMALPSSCNESSCSSQINAKHRGICPPGWHIPSDAEWSTLSSYVEGDKGCSGCDARHLKASNGWSSNGNGTDAYGFSALPGGRGNSVGYFDNVGYNGYWWSASEGSSNNAYLYMDYNYEVVSYGSSYKSGLYSVRCLQD